jgi:hypothetical protein
MIFNSSINLSKPFTAVRYCGAVVAIFPRPEVRHLRVNSAMPKDATELLII